MRNNYREDGFVWFEDQISELADLLLNVQGLAHIYKKKRKHRWIRKVGDADLRSSLRKMKKVQIRMIEELVFEHKTITDIRIETGLTITEICNEIRDMRKKLTAAM